MADPNQAQIAALLALLGEFFCDYCKDIILTYATSEPTKQSSTVHCAASVRIGVP